MRACSRGLGGHNYPKKRKAPVNVMNSKKSFRDKIDEIVSSSDDEENDIENINLDSISDDSWSESSSESE